MKFTWQGPDVSAVTSKGVAEITALKPSASPGSAIFSMRTLPSREVVESFTFPEQSTNAPPWRLPLDKQDCPTGICAEMAGCAERFQHIGRESAEPVLPAQFAA